MTPPSDEEMVELIKLDDKRKNRQSLMQIEDDYAFARIATELIQADAQDVRRAGSANEHEEGEWKVASEVVEGGGGGGGDVSCALGMSDLNTDSARQSKTMRAFFLVRELLVGERNYRKHLVQGIEVSTLVVTETLPWFSCGSSWYQSLSLSLSMSIYL